MAERIQRTSRDGAIWLLAALAGAGLHVFWWTAFSPQELPGSASGPLFPRVSYRPLLVEGDGRVGGNEVQAVWSPILFSLPTHVGFSKSQLTRSTLMLPPADLPAESPLQRGRLPDMADLAGPVGSTMEDQMRLTFSKMQQRPPTPFLPPDPETGTGRASPGLQVIWLDGLSADDFEATSFRAGVSNGALREAVFHVVATEAGLVGRVLLEAGSGDAAWDAEALRAVRGWRAVPGQRRAGRVRIVRAPDTLEEGGRP